jgi:hypothetical protein
MVRTGILCTISHSSKKRCLVVNPKTVTVGRQINILKSFRHVTPRSKLVCSTCFHSDFILKSIGVDHEPLMCTLRNFLDSVVR